VASGPVMFADINYWYLSDHLSNIDHLEGSETNRTTSNIDYLGDGYCWRKYGQKAVKNIPFPG